MRSPVFIIFDIGKTNKKFLLFSSNGKVVLENNIQIPEIKDEDGYPCDDIITMTQWIKLSINEIKSNKSYTIKGIYYSAYGATLVYLDQFGNPIEPVYNYLKPYNESTKILFETKYGPLNILSLETSSPYLGNLNAGLQLFRIKYENPKLFSKIRWALHLPQYLHYIITGKINSEITSIGCHTMLWDFKKNNYHSWVINEGLNKFFPPIVPNAGLHDSTAALIPYLNCINEPFILISTGTWCISLNPFNQTSLTNEELNNDTLFYLSPSGKPIKASRIFLGKKFELEMESLNKSSIDGTEYKIKYENIINEIVEQQIKSTNLILNNTQVKNIYVDGGFSNNLNFINGLVSAYPDFHIFSAKVPQASAIGALLSIKNFNQLNYQNNYFVKTIQHS